MKKFLLSICLALSTSSAVFADISILDASYDKAKQKLSINIYYGGGFEKHRFELNYGPIGETYPMKVTATLVHAEGANDPAERGNLETLTYDVGNLPRPILINIVNEEETSSFQVFVD